MSLGIILVILGTLFLLDNLDVLQFGEVLHYGWPVIFIIWGVSILTRKKPEPVSPAVPFSASLSTDLLHQSNVFGDLVTSVASQNFKGGSVSTVFGDCHLDLSKATFASGDHELRVHSVFGDSVITIPRDAPVAIVASSFLGGLSIMGEHREGMSSDLQWASTTYPTASGRLKIYVSKVFGKATIM